MNTPVFFRQLRLPLFFLALIMVFAQCKTVSIDGAETEYDLLKKGYKRVVMKDYKGAEIGRAHV